MNFIGVTGNWGPQRMSEIRMSRNRMFYPFGVKLLCRCILLGYDDEGEAWLKPLEVFSECNFRVGQVGYCVASRMMRERCRGSKGKKLGVGIGCEVFLQVWERKKAFLFLFWDDSSLFHTSNTKLLFFLKCLFGRWSLLWEHYLILSGWWTWADSYLGKSRRE